MRLRVGPGQTDFAMPAEMLRQLGLQAVQHTVFLGRPLVPQFRLCISDDDGSFKPLVARTFPLEQIVEAHRFLESNQQIGKVVVTV